MAATLTNMLMNSSGMVVNAYHDAEGRGSYFPGSSGTTEGQFLFILGCLEAYVTTGNRHARDMADMALHNVLRVIYRNGRAPSTVTETDIFAPHWLFNVKYPFTPAKIHMDRHFYFETTSEPNGTSRAWIPNDGPEFRTLFNVRSWDSEFLWDNPFSALKSGHFFTVTDVQVGPNETFVYIAEDYTGHAYVTYSTVEGAPIQPNEPFEAWPDWRRLEPSEICCAIDTFIWARRAFALAYQVFRNPSYLLARNATDQQAAIAMDINDSRDWMKPTYTGNPFAVGSVFSHQERFPLAGFSTDEQGRTLIVAQRAADPSQVTVQFGNADRGDIYQNDDRTHVEIGADRRMFVRIFIDQQQQYADHRRYFVNLELSGVEIQNFTLSRIQFKNGAGEELPMDSPVYTFGIETYEREAFNLTIGRVRQTPPREVAYYPGAIPFTANFLGTPATLIDWRGPVYAGYQSPAMWLHTGNMEAAATCTQLLEDAQQQWSAQTGIQALGPFAPVFYFNRDDAVQYGQPNTFGWEGPDPNTKWGGYQYRPLAELAESLRLVPRGGDLDQKLVTMINRWVDWLADDNNWGADALNGATRPAGSPDDEPIFRDTTLGPPTDFPKGPAEINYPEPHFAALILRAIILVDWHENGDWGAAMVTEEGHYLSTEEGEVFETQGPELADTRYSDVPMRALEVREELLTNRSRVVSKCMGLFEGLYRTTGRMAGTFSFNPDELEWYGFWHGEILSTLSQAVHWSEGIRDYPHIASRCRYWLDGLITWGRSNVYTPPVSANGNLWGFPANWSAPVVEEIEFATEVWESASGREQRMSRRVIPRRRLTVNHLLLEEESQAFDTTLKLSQNRPNIVPQWHLGSRTSRKTLISDRQIHLEDSMDGLVPWGGYVALIGTRISEILQVERVDGNVLTLMVGARDPIPVSVGVYPVYEGILEGEMSSTRQTSTVLQAQISFLMLPQDDERLLPEGVAPQTFVVGGDEREVITLRPNWVTPPEVANTWEVERVLNADGPVLPGISADAGRRIVRAKWTLFDLEMVDDYMKMLNRLKGRRVACWLPSWTRDFEISRSSIFGSSIYVKPNAFTQTDALDNPAAAIAVYTFSKQLVCARVLNVVRYDNEVRLDLDRSLFQGGSFDASNVAMISMMYRVRQATDSTAITWITKRVAEVTVSFTTVIGEVNSWSMA